MKAKIMLCALIIQCEFSGCQTNLSSATEASK